MKNIAIVGTGVMAQGIAELLLSTLEHVHLYICGRSIEALQSIEKKLVRDINKNARKGRISELMALNLNEKIQTSLSFDVIADAELIIEVVSEDIEVKSKIFGQINEYRNSTSIVASNTSSLSITQLSQYISNPENVVGLHFFNPAPAMALVEIVSGMLTSQDIVKALEVFSLKIEKKPVLVNEGPGFIVNRMLIPMINEAVCILSEGVASSEDIDRAMRFGANHPMGPLKLADLIGNDVCLSIMETLYDETGDPKYRPQPLLKKYVRAKRLGRKTKVGFFEY